MEDRKRVRKIGKKNKIKRVNNDQPDRISSLVERVDDNLSLNVVLLIPGRRPVVRCSSLMVIVQIV